MEEKHVVIVYSRGHVDERERNKVRKILESHGIRVISEVDAESFQKNHNKIDFIIVLGGDGTLISVAKKVDIPCFGVRYGRVGALSEVPPTRLEEYIKFLVQGKYEVFSSPLLECIIEDINERFYALNDVVIISLDRSLMFIDLLVDEEKIYSIRADGILVATVLGSSAYALSAGGPIVEDSVNGLVITAICPQFGIVPSLVVSNNYKIRINSHVKGEILVIIDGVKVAEISSKCSITIRKSNKVARLIRFKRFSRIKRVLSLMLSGSRVHQA